jgi:hypothetical protein
VNTKRFLNICPSCYTRTWKSSTYCEYGEYIRQLAAAILGRVSHIANMERTAGSCYTWKNHTYGAYREDLMAADTWNIKRIWQLAAAIPGRDAHEVK